uniref:Coiled-coil domain-containing protein 57-like n=1 Tax=Saccoglossus kowalevskii TaxID=10224 RepID=A0ABM0GUJ3_SACKO|nr:PREDICTED: coiled-coil domain-containing protein 57-like [Saccoglossus kowalevskii]
MELAVKRIEDEFQRRHAELDRYAKEKETALTACKESHNERERSLQDTIRELQSQTETKDVEIRRLTWALADNTKEKDIQLEKMRKQLSDFKCNSDSKLADVSHSVVAKDLEIQALRETDGKLRSELAQRKEDVARYKKELSQAMEREASLERSKTQVELDWQRRCEDRERIQYQKSEELISKITTARDEAIALVKERERELQQREDLIRVLSQDRDEAIATLRQHGLTVNRHIIPTRDTADDQDAPASQQIQLLQQQNESLKQVIRTMREEMESFEEKRKSDTADQKKMNNQDCGDRDGPITEDYVRALETEVRELKARSRELKDTDERKSDKTSKPVMDKPLGSIPVNADNAYVRSHIQSLNDTIGALRADKVEAVTQIKKQQTRIEHLDAVMSNVTQEAKQKQLEADQLQYELNAQQRRSTTEISALQQQVSELKLQLKETRKEADEYFKNGLERNLEATSLGQEISSLKMDLASRKPAILTGSQDALVQQLQNEVQYLRNELYNAGKEELTGGSESTAVLRAKLKVAAKHITQLAKERQRLIELGNKLRSELLKYTATSQDPPPRQHPGVVPQGNPWKQPPHQSRYPGQQLHPTQQTKPTSGAQLVDDFQSKLSNLEKLQYELTKQELRFAQRQSPEKVLQPTQDVPRPNVDQRQQQTGYSADLQTTMSTVRSAGSPLLMSLSSYGDGSIQDVWRILDEGPSPSPTFRRSPSPYHNQPLHPSGDFEPRPTIPDGNPSHNLDVAGVRPAMEERQKHEKKQLSNLAAGKYKKSQPKQAIRNYNTK